MTCLRLVAFCAAIAACEELVPDVSCTNAVNAASMLQMNSAVGLKQVQPGASSWPKAKTKTKANKTRDKCTDDDAKAKRYARSKGDTEVLGCIDIGGCEGRIAKFCCATCSGGTGKAPSTSLPAASPNDPVHLFLLGGQSECLGGASSDLLASSDLSSLADVQEGVWFAGIYPRYATDGAFFIAPMKAGQAGIAKFGPEIGFGRRYRDVTGARVLIIKTCQGATSVWKDWNPETDGNKWDRSTDDGTAAWLKMNANASEYTKPSLFKNMVYNARLTTEALAAAGVTYKWKGIIWVQGKSDSENEWCRIGVDTARVFDAFREAVGNIYLPIVDTGCSGKHNLRTGKAYAGELVRGGNVTTVEYAAFSFNPNNTCPGNRQCHDSFYISNDFYNHYGWDPGLKNALQPEGANSKTLRWFIDYPRDGHSEYGGMVFKGMMLANAYIKKFTTLALPADMMAEDPSRLFPWDACSSGTTPTSEHQCWMEQGNSASVDSCNMSLALRYVERR